MEPNREAQDALAVRPEPPARHESPAILGGVTEPSRNFDRAAEFYDRTRALPREAMAQVIPQLAGELAGRGRCLEIGVGTGRISLPLHQAGVPVAGIDVSRAMMAVLVDKAGGWPPFPLAQADATRLPFRDNWFGAGLTCHVLHLILDWRAALAELVRIIRPGGIILAERSANEVGGCIDPIRARMRQEAGVARPFPGASGPAADVDAAIADLGATVRRLPTVVVETMATPRVVIDEIEANYFSWTWALDDSTRHDAAARTRTWAQAEFGSLDQPRRFELQVTWQVYQLP
jgi:SAM-dependent methyltransferase